MLDIVVYADNDRTKSMNISIINRALSDCNIDYRIHKFVSDDSGFNSIIKSDGKKIYIIDSDVDKISAKKVVSKIREYDWDSIIIVIGLWDYDNDRLMILDFISKKREYSRRLIDDLRLAISIINKQKVFVFKYNRMIYRIPFDQICYIEKETNIKRCIIHTLDNQYYIINSIDAIVELLNNDFFRTHQSCIVNLNNIKKVDLSDNVIIFKNDQWTDMLTLKMKKEIKKYLGV